MKIPKVGTKFLYSVNRKDFYIGEMQTDEYYTNIYSYSSKYKMNAILSFPNSFNKYTNHFYNFLIEVQTDDINIVKEDYPEYFI